MDDGSEVLREWGPVLLTEECARLEIAPDADGACFLYDYADVGHAESRWGQGFWRFCPASYVRFNTGPAVMVASAAVEAAAWIKAGAPQWALDGQPPTPRMSELIQMCLMFWRLEEAEAHALALKDAAAGDRTP